MRYTRRNRSVVFPFSFMFNVAFISKIQKSNSSNRFYLLLQNHSHTILKLSSVFSNQGRKMLPSYAFEHLA